MAAAQQASAYRCFLPNLAGLGSADSHGSWTGHLMVYRGYKLVKIAELVPKKEPPGKRR